MKRKFKVLYTHQKAKKRKVWQDGTLTLTGDEKRGYLCDEDNKQLSTVYLNKKQVEDGVDLECDKYLIQVEEEVSHQSEESTQSSQPAFSQNVGKPSDSQTSSGICSQPVQGKVRSKFSVPRKTEVKKELPSEIDKDQNHLQKVNHSINDQSIWCNVTNNENDETDKTNISGTSNVCRNSQPFVRDTNDLLKLLGGDTTETIGKPSLVFQSVKCKKENVTSTTLADINAELPSFLQDSNMTVPSGVSVQPPDAHLRFSDLETDEAKSSIRFETGLKNCENFAKEIVSEMHQSQTSTEQGIANTQSSGALQASYEIGFNQIDVIECVECLVSKIERVADSDLCCLTNHIHINVALDIVQIHEGDSNEIPTNSHTESSPNETVLAEQGCKQELPSFEENHFADSDDKIIPKPEKDVMINIVVKDESKITTNKEEFTSKFIDLSEDLEAEISLQLGFSPHKYRGVQSKDSNLNGAKNSSPKVLLQSLEEPINADKAISDASQTSDFCVPDFDIGLSQFGASPELSIQGQSSIPTRYEIPDATSETEIKFTEIEDSVSINAEAVIEANPQVKKDEFLYKFMVDSEDLDLTLLKADFEKPSKQPVTKATKTVLLDTKTDPGVLLQSFKDEISSIQSIHQPECDGSIEIKDAEPPAKNTFEENEVVLDNDVHESKPELALDEEALNHDKSGFESEEITNLDNSVSYSPLGSSQLSTDDCFSSVSLRESQVLERSSNVQKTLTNLTCRTADQEVPSMFDDFSGISGDDEALLLQACMNLQEDFILHKNSSKMDQTNENSSKKLTGGLVKPQNLEKYLYPGLIMDSKMPKEIRKFHSENGDSLSKRIPTCMDMASKIAVSSASIDQSMFHATPQLNFTSRVPSKNPNEAPLEFSAPEIEVRGKSIRKSEEIYNATFLSSKDLKKPNHAPSYSMVDQLKKKLSYKNAILKTGGVFSDVATNNNALNKILSCKIDADTFAYKASKQDTSSRNHSHFEFLKRVNDKKSINPKKIFNSKHFCDSTVTNQLSMHNLKIKNQFDRTNLQQSFPGFSKQPKFHGQFSESAHDYYGSSQLPGSVLVDSPEYSYISGLKDEHMIPRCFNGKLFDEKEYYHRQTSPNVSFGKLSEDSCSAASLFASYEPKINTESASFTSAFQGSIAAAQDLSNLINTQLPISQEDLQKFDGESETDSSKWHKFCNNDQYVPKNKKLRKKWLEDVVQQEKIKKKSTQSFSPNVQNQTKFSRFRHEASLLNTPKFANNCQFNETSHFSCFSGKQSVQTSKFDTFSDFDDENIYFYNPK